MHGAWCIEAGGGRALHVRELSYPAGMRGLLVMLAACATSPTPGVVVIVSANAEWKAVAPLFPDAPRGTTPWGETLEADIAGERVVLLHGGWGKIAAAASAQGAIDTWHPRLLVNLGTCGGFAGAVQRFDTLLVERTIVYDIVERMGDAAEAIRDYTTAIDVAWVGADAPATRVTLVSGDQDLDPARLAELRAYGAVAGDWESGAIASRREEPHARADPARGQRSGRRTRPGRVRT
jgi:adenosylhomocysteine nucleosidase